MENPMDNEMETRIIEQCMGSFGLGGEKPKILLGRKTTMT